MNESHFINISELELENIAYNIENSDNESLLDVEYNDGILEVEIIANGKKFVINRNSGNKKIWYSSPFTGADYFSYDDKSNKWFNDHNIELNIKLYNELKNNLKNYV